jgi:dTDP-4-amino-4,6-dideoxygalactose transaminase
VTGRVFLSAPDVSDLEASWMLAALRSGWAAPAGPDVDTFECEMAARLGVGHAVALSSGTAALHLALLTLGVTRGHVVIVPTLTFAATANAVVYTGATPYFVDCDPATGNLDPVLVEQVLSDLRRSQRQIGAIVPVDMFGRCADYTTLIPVCEAYGVPIVEDAAEALGSLHHGRAAGTFGAAAALSFNGNKIMTTSGGGMLLTGDRGLAERVRYLATQARQPVPHYEHTDIGYNYRLSNLLAALGRAQLRRLDDMIERRRALRERYEKLFASVDGVTLLGADDPEANCWLTTIVVDPGRTGWEARALAVHLEKRNIETRPLWKPMHLQPVFAGAEAAVNGAAERLFDWGLALPSGSALDELALQRVFAAINNFLDGRSR